MKDRLEAAQEAYQSVCDSIGKASALEKADTDRLQETNKVLDAD